MTKNKRLELSLVALPGMTWIPKISEHIIVMQRNDWVLSNGHCSTIIHGLMVTLISRCGQPVLFARVEHELSFLWNIMLLNIYISGCIYFSSDKYFAHTSGVSGALPLLLSGC